MSKYVANTYERQEKLVRRLEEVDPGMVEWLCAVERHFGLGEFSYEKRSDMLTQERFEERLRGSRAAVELVARWFQSMGFTVEITPTRIASEEERPGYDDGGDLWVSRGGKRKRAEVKHMTGTQFTCCRDFPYQNLMIDEAYKADRIMDRPEFLGYFIVSQDMGAMIPVYPRDKEFWFDQWRQDPADGGKEKLFKMCPMRHLRKWYDMRKFRNAD